MTAPRGTTAGKLTGAEGRCAFGAKGGPSRVTASERKRTLRMAAGNFSMFLSPVHFSLCEFFGGIFCPSSRRRIKQNLVMAFQQ